MTRYQLLKQNEETVFQFVKAGILSFQILRDIEIYEQFNSMEIENNAAKYILLADDYELSPKRIEQIIYNMNKV